MWRILSLIPNRCINRKDDTPLFSTTPSTTFGYTSHRQGVYFEAGFAMGLGLPVIWTCRKDQIDECHFDTRQYNHITWETPEELREKLKDRILATIGSPH